MRHSAAILLLAMLVTVAAASRPASAAGATPLPARDAQSTTGPLPPRGVRLASTFTPSGKARLLSGVPAYRWYHGCGPTAAAMLVGYLDGHGYPALIPGDAASQTAEVNAAIASYGGESDHYADYSLPLDGALPAPLPDRSEPPPGDEHPDNCLADYMRTSQSVVRNQYGWTWFLDLAAGLQRYIEERYGDRYQVDLLVDYATLDDGRAWEGLRRQIDAGQPVVLLVDSSGDGVADHFVTAIGYDTVGGLRGYACFDTWSDVVSWYPFGSLQAGQAYGVFGLVGVELRGQLDAPYFAHLPWVSLEGQIGNP